MASRRWRLRYFDLIEILTAERLLNQDRGEEKPKKKKKETSSFLKNRNTQQE